MNEGVCPAYSDCRIGLSPDKFILDYCDRALGITSAEEKYILPSGNNFSLYLIELFPHQVCSALPDDSFRRNKVLFCH